MIWRDLLLRHKGIVLISIPVLPLMVTTLLFLRVADQRADAARAVDQAWQVTRQLEQLSVSLARAETAVRGFVLTGNASWLEPMQDFTAHRDERLSRLEQIITDPEQSAGLADLRGSVDRRVAALSATCSRPAAAEPLRRSWPGFRTVRC